MKKTLAVLLSISIGLLFIVSAASKIYPMEPFEYQFVDMGIASWQTAPYIARFFIGLEFFLGMLLILNIALRKFTLKFAIALLSVFIIYLAYKIITEGNTGNCGCFGEALKMSPLEGILKNVVLIAGCWVLYIFTEKEYWKSSHLKFMLPVLLIISMGLGFFIYPLDTTLISSVDKTKLNYKVALDLMYADKQAEKPKIDLTKGKQVIAFVSLTCPHCRIAAKKIHVMNKKDPAIPFYLAMNGDKNMQPDFFDDTHTENIPHSLFLGPKEWAKVAGFSLPVIMYINNGIVEKKCDGIELNQDDIEAWLKK